MGLHSLLALTAVQFTCPLLSTTCFAEQYCGITAAVILLQLFEGEMNKALARCWTGIRGELFSLSLKCFPLPLSLHSLRFHSPLSIRQALQMYTHFTETKFVPPNLLHSIIVTSCFGSSSYDKPSHGRSFLRWFRLQARCSRFFRTDPMEKMCGWFGLLTRCVLIQ